MARPKAVQLPKSVINLSIHSAGRNTGWGETSREWSSHLSWPSFTLLHFTRKTSLQGCKIPTYSKFSSQINTWPSIKFHTKKVSKNVKLPPIVGLKYSHFWPRWGSFYKICKFEPWSGPMRKGFLFFKTWSNLKPVTLVMRWDVFIIVG